MSINGCRWQDKSFSVAVSEKIDCICRECGDGADGKYKYNGDILCKECFAKKPNRISLGKFFTHKDLGYNFTTDMFDGKPVEVRSQRHFKYLLKKYNMADASIKECRQEAEFRKKITEEDSIRKRRKLSEQIFVRNKELLKFRR